MARKEMTDKQRRKNIALATKLKSIRVSGVAISEEMPCDWCDKTLKTSLHSIWSIADPVGRIARLCDNCCKSCAGG